MRLEKFGFIYQKFYLIDTLNVYDNIINLEYDITDLTKPKLMD